ncbi:MAG: hypothetical protein CV088_03555 [Nitrospira sp. LK70]|nr:hypothetical protein [Nitrospira sp. LK70]
MQPRKDYGSRLGSLISLTGFTLVLNACGLHQAVLLELEQQDRLAPQKHREKTLAEIKQKEQAALVAQKPISAGDTIPQLYAQALLQGRWEGGACSERATIEIELATADHEAPFSLYVEPADVVGTFRALDHSVPTRPRIIETGLKGTFDYQKGVLRMEATPRPIIPTTEEAEEEYRLRDHAAVEMNLVSEELQYGSRGPWGIENVEQAERNKKALGELKMREALRRTAKAEEYAAKVAAAKAELVPFQFSIARDWEGKGWAGTIDGPHFKGCELRLASKQGITTDKLPPIQMALHGAKHQN